MLGEAAYFFSFFLFFSFSIFLTYYLVLGGDLDPLEQGEVRGYYCIAGMTKTLVDDKGN